HLRWRARSLFGVARLALALSSCGFSKRPRFLNDRPDIRGASVSPGFPRVARATRNNSVQQSVRQYLIEGSELFAVHRYPVARSSWAASIMLATGAMSRMKLKLSLSYSVALIAADDPNSRSV